VYFLGVRPFGAFARIVGQFALFVASPRQRKTFRSMSFSPQKETKTRERKASNTPVVSRWDLSTKQTRETPTEKYNSDDAIPQVKSWNLWFYWSQISLFDALKS
jgi:hypothetical protein